MDSPSKEGVVTAPESTEQRTVYLFLILRMIVAAFVVGAGITIIQVTNDGFPIAPLYVLLAASVVSGGLFYGAVKLGAPVRPALWAIIVFDTALEAGIVHYSGGLSSQFTMIYSLTIVAAAFMLEMPGGLVSAILASVCFISYGMLESIDLVTPPGREHLATTIDSLGVLDTYMHVSMFFMVGIVGGFLARRIQLKGRQLESAETELQQLRVDTDHILTNMSSGILVTDSTMNVITINPAAEEILGISGGAVAGKSLEEALGPGASQLARELRDALEGEASKVRHEIMVEDGRGHRTPLGTSISLLRDAQGQARGVISVFQDLTEVHEMRERVRKADRLAAIGELAAGIAHELRNPLASISGSIEMLAGDLKLEGENGRLMALITRESDRLDRIISDFLDFARLRYPTRQPTDIGAVVEEVLLLLSHNTAKSCGVEVEFTRRGTIPSVRIDDEQMRQVFTNLVVNSCEAMADGGRLDVTLSAKGRDVELVFRDNGPGIELGDTDRLFEPFFTTKEGGTGLGLAIANKIVVAHGGTVEFRNRESGGAEFVIMIPVGRVETEKSGQKKADLEPALAIQTSH